MKLYTLLRHDDLSQEWFYLRPSFLDGLITLGSSVGRGSRLERVAKPMIDVTFLSYLGDRSILYIKERVGHDM